MRKLKKIDIVQIGVTLLFALLISYLFMFYQHQIAQLDKKILEIGITDKK
ncbi:MAG: hypothetical protein AAF363_04160 [Bacteroidota bacterium]